MTKSISKKIILAAFCASPLVATPAFADDGEDGSGSAYIGVSVGYGWNKARANTSTVYDSTGYFAQTSVPAINSAGTQSLNPDAFDAGLDIGYDYRAGNVRIGLAADVSTMNKSKTASTTATYPCCATSTFTVTQTVKPLWMTTVRARLGYDMGGAMIYATGGWAGQRVRYSAQFTDTFATANETAAGSKFRSGWVVGGGADIAMGGGWSIQPEYLHADFGTWNIPGGTLTAFSPAQSYPVNAFSHSVKLRSDIARVGLHYHF